MSTGNPLPYSSETIIQLIIKHAGSLSGVFNEINDEFKRLIQDIDILSGGGGSAALVRDVVNGISCDILASADYNLIPELMYPRYADWCLIFASSRMVLRYSEQSKYAGEINEKNWIDIIQRDGVTIWHSDPNEDPGGYRTLMVLQLAELYYKIPGLYKRLMTPEHDRILSRSNFQESSFGYSFGYGLAGAKGNAKILELPDEINLSRPEFDGQYDQVKIDLSGNNAQGDFSLHGESIKFGLTIPNISGRQNLAAQ